MKSKTIVVEKEILPTTTLVVKKKIRNWIRWFWLSCWVKTLWEEGTVMKVVPTPISDSAMTMIRTKYVSASMDHGVWHATSYMHVMKMHYPS